VPFMVKKCWRKFRSTCSATACESTRISLSTNKRSLTSGCAATTTKKISGRWSEYRVRHNSFHSSTVGTLALDVKESAQFVPDFALCGMLLHPILFVQERRKIPACRCSARNERLVLAISCFVTSLRGCNSTASTAVTKLAQTCPASHGKQNSLLDIIYVYIFVGTFVSYNQFGSGGGWDRKFVRVIMLNVDSMLLDFRSNSKEHGSLTNCHRHPQQN